MRLRLRVRLGQATAIALLASSSVILMGQSPAQAAPGDLDPSFGTGGMVVTTANQMVSGWGIVRQGDGKLVVAGVAGAGDYDFGVARYHQNGTLDAGFGAGGTARTDFGSDMDQAFAVAQTANGSLIVVGRTGLGDPADFALVRYSGGGLPDPFFGSGGKVVSDFGGFDEALGVATAPDGSIVAVGRMSNGGSLDFGVVRYLPNGSFSGSFGGGSGFVKTDFHGGDDSPFGVAIAPDGKIVVAGMVSDLAGTSVFGVARYLTTGALDPTFDGDGKVETNLGGLLNQGAAVGIQPDGKIVVAGQTYLGGAYRYAVVRYQSDGSLDPTFHEDGIVTTHLTSGVDQGMALLLQPDGKIVVGGQAGFGGPTSFDFGIVRYLPDGEQDISFGTGGVVITAFSADADGAFGLVLQPDGKIVAAGHAGGFALARYVGGPNTSVTTTVLTSSVNPVDLNGKLKLTATVYASGQATGTVIFFNGSNQLTRPIPLDAAGQASANLAAITLGGVGQHHLTAVYSGDTTFDPSTGAMVQGVVGLGGGGGG